MAGVRRPFFRQLRIAVLLLILTGVALDMWLQRVRTHDWTKREWVAVYPIAGDNSPASNDFIARLDDSALDAVEKFIATQAAQHGITADLPVDLQLRHRVYGLPPPPPAEPNIPGNAWWSLKMRYWAWQMSRDDPEPETRLRLFLVFHDPALRAELPHSVGLRKLLLGVAHVFAHRRQQPINDVVIAHELMHTLGATDKYHPETNQPIYPQGFAEPDRNPLFPQRFAEIMGGRIPITPQHAEIPPGLRSTRVGPQTATEIGWIR